MTQQTEAKAIQAMLERKVNFDNWMKSGAPGCNDARTLAFAAWQAALESKAQDVQMPEEHEDLYLALHSLSLALESSGRIDQFDHPKAYATILDAMDFVSAGAQTASNSPEFDGVKAAERVPLTEAQVFDAAVGTLPGEAHKLIAVTSPEYADTFEIEPGARWTACEVKPEHSLAFARAIERAHGIGKP